MLAKQAIQVVSNKSPGFYSRIFIVPKQGSDKWRPIIDLSALNQFVVKESFKNGDSGLSLLGVLLGLMSGSLVLIYRTHISMFRYINVFANTFVLCLTMFIMNL